MPETKPRKLTEKQLLFCKEYVIDLNATGAYKRAGYKCKTEKTAAQCGYETLRKPEIQAYVSELRAERGKKTQVTSERIVTELAAIAFHRTVNVMQIKDNIASAVDSDQWDEDSRVAVSEIQGDYFESSSEKGETVTKKVKVKTYDKLKALEILAKITGLTNDFDGAIATLKNYGLTIKRNGDGQFVVEQD